MVPSSARSSRPCHILEDFILQQHYHENMRTHNIYLDLFNGMLFLLMSKITWLPVCHHWHIIFSHEQNDMITWMSSLTCSFFSWAELLVYLDVVTDVSFLLMIAYRVFSWTQTNWAALVHTGWWYLLCSIQSYFNVGMHAVEQTSSFGAEWSSVALTLQYRFVLNCVINFTVMISFT